MNFSDFIKYVVNLIDFQCKYVYLCLPEVRLSEGLHTLQNDYDYSEFLKVANAHRHVNVYIDHDKEPLFDWIEKSQTLEMLTPLWKIVRSVNMKRMTLLYQAKEPIMITF
ncbi:unnamed protein product [Lactuca virosa]|uniref:Uncharacterized protein n=1 Tax=Lactuca virosa TaxID=75947 RepID=A0AAU9LJ55_9ASTR|nr:unnamed protein product [Lactuca virosa]